MLSKLRKLSRLPQNKETQKNIDPPLEISNIAGRMRDDNYIENNDDKIKLLEYAGTKFGNISEYNNVLVCNDNGYVFPIIASNNDITVIETQFKGFGADVRNSRRISGTNNCVIHKIFDKSDNQKVYIVQKLLPKFDNIINKINDDKITKFNVGKFYYGFSKENKIFTCQGDDIQIVSGTELKFILEQLKTINEKQDEKT